ncbi:MAG TPA: kelch repeat-containing protein [Oligoflexus sp.]|uniref:Kelch repeat-containing protein n=1 Tax=Oligoflexus sp. TaxID=1971216 RepID=UPI002D807D56|nr:kelch repeat-containing protein [Oligoflexus sp.]HET9236747.1 kelch repeat-containing protein [Oligoflexus sp.]
MHAQVVMILISLSLGGCFYMPVVSKGKVSTLDEAPRLAATVSSTAGKAISSYDPSAKVATTIPAPSGALAGSSVTLPAGALAIAADLVVEEAVPLSQTSVAGSLAISSDITIKPVGSGLIIRPTENVDLTKPLTIAMPINPTAGLALNNGKYYTVFYKYFVNGELKAGAIASSDLRFSEAGSVLFEGYFGAYWLAEVSAPIAEKLEVTTAEPIVNKDNVAVVTHTGVVTETEVLSKASIPVVKWLNVSLSMDSAQRTVKAAASIESGRSLNACQVDLFEKIEATGGLNIEAGSSLSVSYKIAKVEAHTLYARFRCMDDQARQTISPWSSAVSVPGAAAPVAQPASNFCGAGAPELRLTTTTYTAAGTYATKAFTAAGNCVYTVDMDAIWGGGFGIATADGKTRCFANQGSFVGEQTVSCMASTDTSPNLWLPQGNYTIQLDFSASASNPKMTIGLQSCNIGDLYLLTTSDYYNWPTPATTNRMNHLGGCQYAVEANKVIEGTQYIRIQNLNGSYSCGDGSTLDPHNQKTISCGSTPGYYTLSAYGSFVVGHKYLLNLGNNLDMNGQPTATPYLWAQEVDKCQENRYILGPTSAGNNRQPGVNSFMKNGSCMFEYSFIQSGASFSPFFIGIGEGADKCGVAPATGASSSVYLDCSTSAVGIDFQSSVSANNAYRITIQSDIYTGRPNYVNINPIANVCMDPLYAVKNATTGFRPSLQESLTEISECIYQYEWTPTAASRSLSFVNGNNPGYRCGKFPGRMDPVVNGPAVDGSCYNNYDLAVDYPFTPIGVVDGQRYKINLDFRLGMDRPRINIASHTMAACPELYVTGFGGLPNYPHSSNKMTQTGDCNYSFHFKTPPTTPAYNFRVTDASGNLQCGRMNYNPSTSGSTQTVSMSCGVSPATDFSIGLGTDAHYQVNVHYESGGESNLSIVNMWRPCYSMLDGPSGVEQNAGYTRNTTTVGQCVEEMLWVPTSTTNAFVLRSDYYGNAHYCGLQAGSPQPNLAGGEANALCSIFNVTSSHNVSLANGITPGSKYLVRLDRGETPYDPAKISISPVGNVYAPTQAAWIQGSSAYNSNNTPAYPGARRGAAVWVPEASSFRYMFGGLGYADNAAQSNLADLWRFDTANQTWTLEPDGTYGNPLGFVSTWGTPHPLNRPGGRDSALAIFDPTGAGKLWLFGGSGVSTSGGPGYMNDLWTYDLGTNEWTLVSGDPTIIDQNGVMNAFNVPATTNRPGARVASSGWFHAGKLYVFGGYGYPDSSSPFAGARGHLNDLWVFDTAAKTWAMINGSNLHDNPGDATMPSARRWTMQWKAPNGLVWLFGGHGAASNGVGYLNDMWSYNSATNTWTRFGGPDFINGTMVSGMRSVSSNIIWPASRFAATTWTSSDGKLYMFGGDGRTTNWGNSGYLSDIWNFDPLTGQWTWLAGLTQNSNGVESPWASLPGGYVPQGTFSSLTPGSRSNAMSWPDSSGNVYIFGGVSNYGYFNDLWYLDF